jgi:hypothetical protein
MDGPTKATIGLGSTLFNAAFDGSPLSVVPLVMMGM